MGLQEAHIIEKTEREKSHKTMTTTVILYIHKADDTLIYGHTKKSHTKTQMKKIETISRCQRQKLLLILFP
jgi:hypothetical protein